MSQSVEAAVGYRAETRRLVAAGVLVSTFGLVTKAFGQMRESASAAIFGATRAVDAFNVAKALPDMFSSWIETPVRSAIVPLFTRLRAEQGSAEAWRAASNVVNTLALFMAVLAGVLWLSADVLVRVLSPGFHDPAAWDSAASLARIVVVSVVFSVLTEILNALSNIHGRQFVPAIGRLINVAVVLAFVVFLGRRIGLAGYAWGFLAGSIAYFALQTNIVWRHRREWRWTVQPRAPEIRQVVTLGTPLFIGLIGPRLDVLLDQAFASSLPKGSLTILALTRVFSSAITDIVQSVSIAVLLPHFATLVAARRLDELRARLEQTLAGYLFFSLPMLAFIVIASQPLIDLLYRHGRFGAEQAAIAALVLPIFAIADPAFGWGQILAQVHIARGDTVTPMKIGFLRIAFKLVLSIALIVPLGIYGLALATSLSTFFRTLQLWRRLPVEVRPRWSGFLAHARGLVVPVLASAAVVFVFGRMVPRPHGLLLQGLRLGVTALACGSVYFAIAWVQGHEVARRIAAKVRG